MHRFDLDLAKDEVGLLRACLAVGADVVDQVFVGAVVDRDGNDDPASPDETAAIVSAPDRDLCSAAVAGDEVTSHAADCLSPASALSSRCRETT